MQDSEEPVDQNKLLALYRAAVKSGESKLAEISYEAMRAAAKAEALNAEARRLAALAQEM